MAKFAVIILVCLAVIQSSYALKCNRCNNECEKLTEETCMDPPTGSMASCLTYVYTDSKNKQMTDKKCVNVLKGSKYACIDAPGTKEVSCETCSTDLCNAAPKFGPAAALIAVVLGLLVPKFL